MKKLITSALPYVNNVPHLGNIIGSVLSADVYARFCRLRGYETLYICGNDEYGTATENKAREEGLSPKGICDKYHAIHKSIYETFNISFDAFGRTSDPEQTEIVQQLFLALDAAGMITEETTQRVYCEQDAMFLADRYVEGTCPKCGYEDARGDQCDKCGALLDPESLLNPRCKVCSRSPIKRDTTHLYLNLPRLQEPLSQWVARSSEAGKWTRNAIQTTLAWLDRGLDSRPITRDLKWGIPVPKPGFEDKVFYVWFDAPIGYISITAKAFPESWRSWWQNPSETQLYQFMAKDNIPFHTIVFPASLIGSKQNWTLLHHIDSTEYLNYEDSKFSKSRNIGVFGTDVKETGIAIDLWRFYLLLNRPERSDSVFTWLEFFERANSEFIDNIGNLVNRGLTYLLKNYEGAIRDLPLDAAQITFCEGCKQDLAQLTELLEAVRLREALRQILELGNRANKFFHDAAPWERIKTDRDHAHATTSLLVYAIRALSTVLEPFMPETAARIANMLAIEAPSWSEAASFCGLDGHKIGTPEILFPKLELPLAERLRKKFSGNAPQFNRFQLVAGQILEVAAHPHSDRLYLLKVTIGEAEPRQIVAGLTKHYRAAELLDRKVIVLANLAPATIQGELSQGMLLACERRKDLELLDGEPFEIGAIAQIDHSEQREAALGEIDIDSFKNAPFKLEGKQVRFDELPVHISGTPLGTRKLEHGKLR